MVKVTEEVLFEGGALFTAEMLGLVVQEDSQGVMSFDNCLPEGEAKVSLSISQFRFLAALFVFAAREYSASDRPSYLASWLEGYRTASKPNPQISFGRRRGKLS
ncbi:hypothetical protein [Gluconacetobacter sp.]|uniref:hypothetical protein n=1 Tax=Gluconacetobacter sp. TaxID=1935994 RepID=UPI0039EC2D11